MKQDLGRLVKQITLLFTLFLFGSLSTSAQEKVHDTTRLSSFEKIDSVSFRNVYWALKTNALYDVALVPNVGVEIYLGKQWSVVGNWMYAWWSNRGKNNFWRIYGGDVETRRWLGRIAA